MKKGIKLLASVLLIASLVTTPVYAAENNNTDQTAMLYFWSDLAVQQMSLVLNQITTPNMTTMEKVTAIHDWIIANSEFNYNVYLDDPALQPYAYSADGPLFYKKSTSQGYASLMYLALILSNIPSKMLLYVNNVTLQSHVWNRVLIDNKWYDIDLAYEEQLTDMNIPDAKSYCFLVSQSEMEQLHGFKSIEDSMNSPATTSLTISVQQADNKK